jgi:ACS family tartrate transporter-like MFS transporter
MKDVFSKVALRIMPFLILLYVVAFLDRVNVGFASLTMNRDLQISDSAYGFAAGMFFVGYFLCEVPSNLLLKRFGARIWIARIMITWGVLSVAMAFTRGTSSYVMLRTLLGAAEAGFFPGIILYLTIWLPPSRRAGLMSLFTFGIPLANVVGGPISTALLAHHFSGHLKPWQWLFILEGVPAVLLGTVVPLILSNSPQDASWLSEQEQTTIVLAQLAESPKQNEERVSWRRFCTPMFAALTVVYFVLMSELYGLGFWLPKLLQARGTPLANIGWLSALAYGSGGILAVAWAYHSDFARERRWHLFTALAAAAIGQTIVALSHSPSYSQCGFMLSAFGIFSGMPIFWSIVTSNLSGASAAVGTALVNSFGNLGGFAGPSWIGWITARTGSFKQGMLTLAVLLLIAGLLSIFVSTKVRPVLREDLRPC